MNLNKPRMLRLLQELEKIAAELKKYEGQTFESLSRDLSLRWTVERGLQAGLSIIFNIADHILAADFIIYPETYEESLEKLKQVGVISEELYKLLKGSGGFRNILAHEYVEIDLNLVAQVLNKAPNIFRRFGGEFLRQLED